MAQAYIPTTEADAARFLRTWCGRCAKHRPNSTRPCPVLGRARTVAGPGLPREWFRDEDGPRCNRHAPKTAYCPMGSTGLIRDTRQAVMPW